MSPDPEPVDNAVTFDRPGVVLSLESSQSSSSLLHLLHSHHCLINVLSFLSFQDLGNFSLLSKESFTVRSLKELDQTRSGTIRLGRGVRNIVELMSKAREQNWCKTFRGDRTHLCLLGLNCLSPDIEAIDEEFIKQCSPLKHVISLDCWQLPEKSMEAYIIFSYQNYVSKGLAHGVAISLLVPNLREIDISHLPLTSLGLAWIVERNPNLERIRWNRSLIWPINDSPCNILGACRNVKELYIDDSVLLFTQSRCLWPRRIRRRQESEEQLDPDNTANDNDGQNRNRGNNVDSNSNGDEDEDDDYVTATEAIWSSLTGNVQSLVQVSCRRARWHNQRSKIKTIGETKEGQASLMRFVRLAKNLKWFRSDLLDENIAVLKIERPGIAFCR